MIRKILFVVVILLTSDVFAQIPAPGIYTYHIKWAEWNGMAGPSVKVVIRKDSVFVYTTDNSLSNTKKGDLLEKGKIMYHRKLKKWIIATQPGDIYSPEVGGCSDGPTEIDFKHKWFWMC